MTEEIKLSDRILRMEQIVTAPEVQEALRNAKKKKWGLKWKGMLGRKKLKKGYCIVEEEGENKAVRFRKEPIIESTIMLDETFHSLTADDLLTYKNKPFVRIHKGKINPNNFNKKDNETRGQKNIMNRMVTEAIKPKKTFGAIGWWIFILLIIGAVVYYYSKSKGAA